MPTRRTFLIAGGAGVAVVAGTVAGVRGCASSPIPQPGQDAPCVSKSKMTTESHIGGEGAFDAIAVTRATDGRAVGLAPMGTALTDAQGDLLAAVANGRSILEATDSDRAGREAAAKDHTVLMDRDADLRRLVLVDPTDPTATIKDPGELIERPHGAETLAALVEAVDVAPSVTAERVVDSVDRARLAENVGTRVHVARQVGRIIATAPASTWRAEIDSAARALADRAGDRDVDYATELVTAETARAAGDLVPAGVVDRRDLDALATRARSTQTHARLARIRTNLSNLTGDQTPGRLKRPTVDDAPSRTHPDGLTRGPGLSR